MNYPIEKDHSIEGQLLLKDECNPHHNPHDDCRDHRDDCNRHPHPRMRLRGEYLANDLISRSWYLSGIVARRLQSVTGDQAMDGLFLLNALLDWKSIQIDLIPYWTYYEFPAQIGKRAIFHSQFICGGNTYFQYWNG